MQRNLTLPSRTASSGAPDSVTFIGNATLLLRVNGITLLTDPNFLHVGDHAHIGYGMSSKRLTNPAIELADLPAYDAVLLSHYHGDHFDQIVERELPKTTPIVTTHHAAKALAGKGFQATIPLTTWDSVVIDNGASALRLTAMPGKHGPGAIAALLPPVIGTMIEPERPTTARRRKIYISGDTLIHAALREIPRRFPDIDIAFLHLGGTRVLGVLVTLDGHGGVEALRILDPQRVFPIHYEDYTVFKSPLSDFLRTASAAGYADRIRVLGRGEHFPL